MSSVLINKAQLHPLVLMSITDIITRHISRGLTTPLLGGLMGQQTRDGVTVEQNFDILLLPNEDGNKWHVDSNFFDERHRQLLEVHKEPNQLEFVGFWTLSPSNAGIDEILQKELGSILPELVKTNESPLALAFHTDLLLEQMSGQGGNQDSSSGASKMPFTVYEPVRAEPQPSSIDTEADEKTIVPQSFHEIPWEMQTGEAEMIGLEFVKTGAGNATRVRTGAATTASSNDELNVSANAGDAKSQSGNTSKVNQKGPSKRSAADLYTPEDEEMLSFLNTRANAMRTLLARLSVIRKYLSEAKENPESANLELMRAIKALLSRLPGVEAAKREQTGEDQNTQHIKKESSLVQAIPQPSPADVSLTDATLIELLGALGRSIQGARELGGKFQVVDSAKRENRRRDGMMPGGLPAGLEGRFGEEMMDLT